MADTERQFRERVRSLIAGAPQGQGAGTEVHRADVEEIGSSLGMRPEQACREFLGMKGNVWKFAHGGSFTTHTVHSAEDERHPRNWTALTNIVLV